MKKIISLILCCVLSFGAFAAQQEKIFGNIKVVLHDLSFTHSLYFVDSNTGKTTPLFDSIDASSNNRFYLQTDLMMYSLTKSSGVIGSQQFTDTGFRILYEIKSVATLLFDYVFSASPQAKPGEYDLLDLKVYVTNTHKKTQNLALKAVYDTYLGEKLQNHFSTKIEPFVLSEMSFSRLAEEAWIRSSDGMRSVQFNFDSKPTQAINARLANKDFVLTQSWDVNGLTGRSFNSVYSYNNSAVALYWQSQRLEPEKNATFSLSLSFAQNGQLPYSGKNGTEKEPVRELQAEKKSEEVKKETYVEVNEVEERQKLTPPLDDLSVQAENPYAYTKTITNEQLDKAYIDALLSKIEALENNGSSLDRAEILKLNAELDAILEFLRN